MKPAWSLFAPTRPQPYSAGIGVDYDDYFRQVAVNYREFTNGTECYRKLVDALDRLPGVGIVPVYELAGVEDTNRARIALRHDIDADPVVAVELARHLARVGVVASFYVLHSALYYGSMHGGTFVRNPAATEWLRALVVAGCEIGLHNDALGMYHQHGVDPGQVLQTEIDWLRANGACVRGTVAHNCIASQGAENYEVFSNRVLWWRSVSSRAGGRTSLGGVTMDALGLSYEGTFARPRETVDVEAASRFAAQTADIRDEAWMRAYLSSNPTCEWAIDYQIWLIGRDRWVIAGGETRGDVFVFDCDTVDVLEFARTLPPASRSILVLHPEYFGDYASPTPPRNA